MHITHIFIIACVHAHTQRGREREKERERKRERSTTHVNSIQWYQVSVFQYIEKLMSRIIPINAIIL